MAAVSSGAAGASEEEAEPEGSVSVKSSRGSLEDEESESERGGSESGTTGSQEVQDRDRLLHWWCQRQLQRCLHKLRNCEHVAPFLEPMPIEELGLDDYLEVIDTPMDLLTIHETLERGDYEDEDGLIDPELFWADVALCWENCMTYYSEEPDEPAYQLAKSMQEEADTVENEFWRELEAFEGNIEEIDPTLGQVAAAVDVAAGAMEDVARAAYDSVAAWMRSLTADEARVEFSKRSKAQAAAPYREKKLDFAGETIRSYEIDFDPNGPVSPLMYQLYRKPALPLREHFGNVLESRYRYDAQKEFEDIDMQLTSSINLACKSLDEREDPEEFDGLRDKIPVQKLFPTLSRARRGQKKGQAGSEMLRRVSSGAVGVDRPRLRRSSSHCGDDSGRSRRRRSCDMHSSSSNVSGSKGSKTGSRGSRLSVTTPRHLEMTAHESAVMKTLFKDEEEEKQKSEGQQPEVQAMKTSELKDIMKKRRKPP